MIANKKITVFILLAAIAICTFICAPVTAGAADGVPIDIGGATVRTEDGEYSDGIVFNIVMSREQYEKGFEEAGVVMVPEKLLSGDSIADSGRAVFAKTENWTEDSGNMVGNVYVYGIPEGSYGSDLIVAAYIKKDGKTSCSEEYRFTLSEVAMAAVENQPDAEKSLKDYYTFYVQLGDGDITAYEYGDSLAEPSAQECEADVIWTNQEGSAVWDFDTMVVTGQMLLKKEVGSFKHTFEDNHGECAYCDVWGIKDAADFEKINDDLEGNYILTADIDLGDIKAYGVGVTSTTEFLGVLDGDGYTLTYTLYSKTDTGDINADGAEGPGYKALFGTIGESGIIRNVGLNIKSVGSWKDDATYWGGAPMRAGIAFYNEGLIENVFVNMSFTQPGSEKNGTGSWAQAALVQDNLAGGVISNVVVNVSYTGAKDITQAGIDVAQEQSLCVIGKNREGATVENLIYCQNIKYETSVKGYIALCSHRTETEGGRPENMGEWINVMPMNNKADSHTDYSAVKLIEMWDDFVLGGFEEGKLWEKSSDGIKFGGKLAIPAS